MSLLNKIGFGLAIFTIICIGLYPYAYLFIEWPFGLLMSKSDALLTDFFWQVGFFMHIIPGSIALLSGWSQFVSSWRNRKLNFHRLLGKVYVLACLISGLGGFYIAFFATGGWIAKAGFLGLAIFWLVSTAIAYRSIRKKDVSRHQIWMIYSYAACLAAVTLRIWLPLFSAVLQDFILAYRIIAWFCWVPNLILAFFVVRKIS